MAKLFWLRGKDGSYDCQEELRQSRERSRYDAALLVARLMTALNDGRRAVDQDQVLGSELWFHSSGDEGLFYLLGPPAEPDVTVVWVGTRRRRNFGEIYAVAERRVAELE